MSVLGNTSRVRVLTAGLAAAGLLTGCGAAFAQVAINPTTFQTAGAFTTVLTTLNAGFFSQGSAFASVPPNPQIDQMGRGVWIRANAGLFDIKGTASIPATGASTAIKTRSTYGGVQAGIDLGNFNLSGTGLNVVYGLTGGQVNVDGSAFGLAGRSSYDIPFGGAYVVVSKGGFVAEASYRHDFYSVSLFDPSDNVNIPSLNGNSDTGAASLTYKYSLPEDIFIEPSAAFTVSRFTIGGFTVPGVPVGSGGIFQAHPIDSDLGRVGARVGKSFLVGDILLEPFVAASVWHEFAGANSASFTSAIPAVGTISGTATRVGTFGQYSAGISASLGSSGLLAFVRGDYRSGSNLVGNNVSGGVRYQF